MKYARRLARAPGGSVITLASALALQAAASPPNQCQRYLQNSCADS